MSKKLLLIFFATITLLLIFNQSVLGQTERHMAIGLEVQQYPTGFLLGLRGETNFKEHHGFDFRAGLNKFDHKDFGVQDSEEGVGYGASLGYHYYFKNGYSGFFIGARFDIWKNKVNWRMDNIGISDFEGTTRLVVVQPTALVGYSVYVKEYLILTPKLAAGMEINAKTVGEEVGEGPILLWGLSVSYRLTYNKKMESSTLAN